jgi:serine/threonine protein kinase
MFGTLHESKDSQVLDRFKLIRTLYTQAANNSGMFIAKDLKTSKEVVLKRLDGRGGEMEASMHKRLVDHPNIVQMVHFSPLISNAHLMMLPRPLDEFSDFYIRSKRFGRLYLELCSAVVGGNQLSTLRELRHSFMQRGKNIPELFIWSIYADLLKALCFMWFGIRDVKSEVFPAEGWKPILHRDIHLGNIFVADSSPESRPSGNNDKKTSEQSSSQTSATSTLTPTEYPRVVLGDFGNSGPLSSDHQKPPSYPAEEYAMWDLAQLHQVMKDLCEDPTTEKNKYSQELIDALEPLDKTKRKIRLIPELLGHAKMVVGKMEELVEKGVLVFEPL